MPDPTQERLDDLGKQIDEARHDAEEHGLLPDTTEEPTFEDPDPDDDDGDAQGEAVPPDSPARGVVDEESDDTPEPSEPA
jgi:hypothetical protein